MADVDPDCGYLLALSVFVDPFVCLGHPWGEGFEGYVLRLCFPVQLLSGHIVPTDKGRMSGILGNNHSGFDFHQIVIVIVCNRNVS